MTEEHKAPVAGHTPWTVIDNSWEVSTVYDADGNTMAVCPIDHTVDEETQDHFERLKDQRARLISASPELLDACEAAEFLLAALCVDRESSTRTALRAAILAATGEQS